MTTAPEYLVRRRAPEAPPDASAPQPRDEQEHVPFLLDPQATAGNQAISAALSSPSLPLDRTLRAEMEERTGADLAGVRIHAGATAAESACALDADAYTVGREIVFAAGRFDPDGARGRQLLAHELAHVVQQRLVSEPRLELAPEADAYERAADRVAAGEGVHLAPLHAGAPAVQRQPAATASPPAQRTAARRPQITEEERGEMKADVETIVGELRSSFFTDEWKIVGLILKWSDRDRVYTEQTGYSGTDYLDAFLLQTKMRSYSRHTAGSAWVERWGIVFDDVWHELAGQRLRTWKETVAKSQKQGTDGPREGPPENFWKTLSRQEAIGLWGVMKGMGTTAAGGLVDAPAKAIVEGLRAVGVPAENPESAAAWLQKQYDISGEAMFGKEYSQGDPLFLGLTAADIGTAGGAVIWQLVMLGRGKGGAAWATKALAAMGIIGSLGSVSSSAKAIAKMIEDRQKAGVPITAADLANDPQFRRECTNLVANIVAAMTAASGLGAGAKPDAAAQATLAAWKAVGLVVDAAQLGERLGTLVQVGLGPLPAAEKDKQIAHVLAEVLSAAIQVGTGVKEHREATVKPPEQQRPPVRERDVPPAEPEVATAQAQREGEQPVRTQEPELPAQRDERPIRTEGEKPTLGGPPPDKPLLIPPKEEVPQPGAATAQQLEQRPTEKAPPAPAVEVETQQRTEAETPPSEQVHAAQEEREAPAKAAAEKELAKPEQRPVPLKAEKEAEVEFDPDWWKRRPEPEIQKPVSGLETTKEFEGQGTLAKFQERNLEPSTEPTPGVYKGKRFATAIPGVKKTRPEFGPESEERAGTFERKGTSYGELNAAEIDRGLRIDYDPKAGRPRAVSYRLDGENAELAAETERTFTADVSTEGAQSRDAAYTNSGYDRGHLAQREAMKGSADIESAADHWTNVVPMKPELNRGKGSPWRAAEANTVKWAKQYGSVSVSVIPIYDANPPRLSDGTPIPKAITRMVVAPDGSILDNQTFLNR